jgi:hypothetical protein
MRRVADGVSSHLRQKKIPDVSALPRTQVHESRHRAGIGIIYPQWSSHQGLTPISDWFVGFVLDDWDQERSDRV